MAGASGQSADVAKVGALNVALLTKHGVSLVTVNKQHFFLPTFQTPNAPIDAHVTSLHLSMATIGDSTDPEGTKRPNKDLILESAHTFELIIVTEHPSRPNLPANISPINTLLWAPWEVCHKVLGAGVHQVTEVARVSFGAHLAHLAYGMSCASSMSNLDIYRSLISPLWEHCTQYLVIYEIDLVLLLLLLIFCDILTVLLPYTSSYQSLRRVSLSDVTL